MLRRIATVVLICSHASALRPTRRQALKGSTASTVMLNFLPGAARAAAKGFGLPTKETNDVVTTVDGIRRKRLGNSDIAVSELALGTQRWGGADFNSPDEELCHQLLDRGVLEGGINLIDTAEQYPIPSVRSRPEGATAGGHHGGDYWEMAQERLRSTKQSCAGVENHRWKKYK